MVDQEIRERLRRTGRNEGSYVIALQEHVRGDPMPPEPESEAAVSADQPPAGVHAGSHAIHERVRERMRELERGEDEYVGTLEEILAEEA